MRVDSNTKGHVTWFFFKVTNFKEEMVTFNIINFQKSGLLYRAGMKPYTLRSSGGGWRQEEIDV